MQITIDTHKMLRVLLHHSMEEKDAKAILYDLITGSDFACQVGEEETEQTTEETTGQITEEGSSGKEEYPVRPKRKVSFSSFGGNAEPLR